MRYLLTLCYNDGKTHTAYSDSAEIGYLFTWYPTLASVTVEHAQ